MRLLLALIVLTTAARADDSPLAEYFRSETAKLAARPLLGIDSAEAWKARRPELQRQLREMLGLDPLPEKSDLKPRITGTIERHGFIVEKLLYQSMPGLYVTANLYRPKDVKGPLPTILYLCGHSDVKKNGIIYGCKTHYQHHAAWYAANGYVCLILDTLQLGELPGLHHGTYREGMWWWQSRGYTPAGVEAWNAVRGIDYLLTRPEVDKEKIGVTGRSGGGATSWWVAAIDDRVAAAVPVAGITDLTNHVVEAPKGPYRDGVIAGHCDCMYFVNTYRWDFPLVAALVAPRPLLIENTDSDPIFPEDGVRRIYRQLEKVYGWYGARDKLGLVIGSGGHVDSEEIRHPSFAFFEKWFRGKDHATIEEPDRSIAIEDLKVLAPGEVPPDCRNATIQETFVPKAKAPPVPESKEDWEKLRSKWMEQLKSKVFAGWPKEDEAVPLDARVTVEVVREGVRIRAIDYTSQEGVRLRLWLLSKGNPEKADLIAWVLDKDDWRRWSWLPELTADRTERMRAQIEKYDRGALEQTFMLEAVGGGLTELALIVPRGVGPSAWDDRADTQLRRRFALLGQTLAGMQSWDIRRALAALRQVSGLGQEGLSLWAGHQAATLALWAAFADLKVAGILLVSPPPTVRRGPALLNLGRVLEMPQAASVLGARPVLILTDDQPAWRWDSELMKIIKPEDPWITFEAEKAR